MKKRLSFLAVLAISLLAFTACNDDSASSDHSNHAGQAAAQTICPVSGESLGSMGEPIVVTHEGKEVKLCCKSCIKKFNADPVTYVSRVHDS